MFKKNIIILIFIFSLSGCLFVSKYSVSSYDYKQIEEELRLKALEIKIERSKRVNNVGYRLLVRVPQKNKPLNYYLGILTSLNDSYISKLYNLSDDVNRLVVYGVVSGSPADRAGIKEGDIVLSVSGKKVNKYNFDNILRNINSTKEIPIIVKRKDADWEISIIPEPVAFNIPFLVRESTEINSFASPDGVTIMYGLLDFIDNDDELAVVIANEMAHITRSHILKGSGVGLFSRILALAVGSAELPQSGDLGSIAGTFSKTSYKSSLESESDIYAILYVFNSGFNVKKGLEAWERLSIEDPQSLGENFGATHPISFERLKKQKEIFKKLEDGTIKEEDYKNA